MKFITALVTVAAAGFAAAQSQCLSAATAIPSCGQACLTSAASSFGCAFTDFACQCSHSSQINNAALTTCVLSACSDAQTALAVSSGAEAVCSCVASNKGGANSPASSVAAPATTQALPGAGSKNNGNGNSNMPVSSHTTAKMSMFTGGGAAVAAGSVGGVMAGVIGLIAAL